MARPQKRGLDYFPLDTVLDVKFDLIEAEFGLTGFAVIVKLLQKIYAEQGYYCEYTNEVALLFSRKLGFADGGNVVSEIVSASIKRGIFNAELFTKYQVLTSAGIQKRYFEAVSRRAVTVENRYLLLNANLLPSNVSINEDIVYINSEIVCNNATKEIKSNYIKLNDTTVSEVFSLFNKVCTRLKPLSDRINYKREKETLNLLREFSLNDIKSVFEKVNASSFLCGENQRKWKADFNWIIMHDKFVTILEGKYDGNESNKQTSYDIGEIDEFWNKVPKL